MSAIATDGHCCLLSPSGCGKTSTLRMIAGHESLSAGDIRHGWLQPPRQTLVALRDGAVAGFGTLRRCRSGFKVGPLFADGPDAAATLLAALAGLAPGEAIDMDVPEHHSAFAGRLAAWGLAPVFETAGMCRGAAPPLRAERVYGITTLELG